MKARIRKWGNSLAVRIPKSVAEEAGLQLDSAVEVATNAGKVVLTPIKQSRKLKLEDLVEQITPENRHDEIDFGPPMGNEVW